MAHGGGSGDEAVRERLRPPHTGGGEYVPAGGGEGHLPLRAGGGAEPPEHPGQAAVLFLAAGRQEPGRRVLSALFPQRTGGLYLHRPQRHDAGAEENAGREAGGYSGPPGAAASGDLSGCLTQVKIDGPAHWCYNKTENGRTAPMTQWRMPDYNEKEP